MKVELFQDCARIELSKNVYRDISLEDFKELFLSGIDDLEKEISEELILPTGCFYSKISSKDIVLTCYFPERKSTIKYQGRSLEEYTIPIPNIIINFHVRKTDQGFNLGYDDVKYYVTDKTLDQISSISRDNLFNYPIIRQVPFTNFYNNGKMCYGGNTMPSRFNNNLRGLDYYYKVISISPFNEDLGVKGMKSSFSGKSLFEYLSEKETFPYEDLA